MSRPFPASVLTTEHIGGKRVAYVRTVDVSGLPHVEEVQLNPGTVVHDFLRVVRREDGRLVLAELEVVG